MGHLGDLTLACHCTLFSLAFPMGHLGDLTLAYHCTLFSRAFPMGHLGDLTQLMFLGNGPREREVYRDEPVALQVVVVVVRVVWRGDDFFPFGF